MDVSLHRNSKIDEKKIKVMVHGQKRVDEMTTASPTNRTTLKAVFSGWEANCTQLAVDRSVAFSWAPSVGRIVS